MPRRISLILCYLLIVLSTAGDLMKDGWKFYKNKNCHNSKGANQISPHHLLDVEKCKSICEKSPTCEGFVYRDPPNCELLKDILIRECEYSPYWQMYVKPKKMEEVDADYEKFRKKLKKDKEEHGKKLEESDQNKIPNFLQINPKQNVEIQKIIRREQSEMKLPLMNQKDLNRTKSANDFYLYSKHIESNNGTRYLYKAKSLSHGAFGNVHEGIIVDDSANVKKVAIKIQEDDIHGQLEEKLMKELSGSKNIIQYKDSIVRYGRMYIVMEYCSGGSLESKLQNRVSEKNAQIIFEQIAYGLKSIHENNIIHFDLKPNNIVFREENDITTLKLIDFGISQKCNYRIKDRCIRGTIPYIAPEILARESITKKSDIWSMGVILYQIMFQRYPFDGKDLHDLKMAVDRAVQNKLKFPKCSDNVKDLISGMLKKNPEDRFTLDDIINHKWFPRNNVQKEKETEAERIQKLHQEQEERVERLRKLQKEKEAEAERVRKEKEKKEAKKIGKKAEILCNDMLVNNNQKVNGNIKAHNNGEGIMNRLMKRHDQEKQLKKIFDDLDKELDKKRSDIEDITLRINELKTKNNGLEGEKKIIVDQKISNLRVQKYEIKEAMKSLKKRKDDLIKSNYD